MVEGRLHAIGARSNYAIDEKNHVATDDAQADIACYAGEKTVGVDASASMNRSQGHAARSQLTLDEQKDTITHNPMLTIGL